MQPRILPYVLIVASLVGPLYVAAEETTPAITEATSNPKQEFEEVSLNGSITRGPCPHTCAARAIPKDACREWRSRMDPDQCYVQDLRLPSNAIPSGLDGKK